MNKIIEFFKTEDGKIILPIIAGVIMYFTPDPVDEIITALLAAYGLTVWKMGTSNENKTNK